eukprot:11203598-Lingulodinium_polyedra.AAC.1
MACVSGPPPRCSTTGARSSARRPRRAASGVPWSVSMRRPMSGSGVALAGRNRLGPRRPQSPGGARRPPGRA